MTMTLKRMPQPPSPAAMKAERERDKAQAMRDYQAEQLARQANMARLRDLRLAKERADALAAAARRPATKKASIGVPAPAQPRRRARKTS
ncbi:MAG TPA: transcriptional regulator [Pseudolabrys sp.]|nr:transcriptional regulator [Pseudolabrys sp.]